MKKIITIILVLIFCFAFSIPAFAEDGEKEETIDASQPRLMVTAFELEKGYLVPNKKRTLKVTLKNYSKTKALYNIKLSFAEESGELKPVGTGTQYVERIYAGSTYTWELEVTASATAQIGEHIVSVTSEYEDKYYNAYSGSDTLRLNVKQKTSLDVGGIQVPLKITEGDTVTVDLHFMNSGKCKIRNLKAECEMENIDGGGTVFVGDIEAGESGEASMNLRANNTLGKTKGTITVFYENEFGDSFEKKADVETEIIEKTEETSADKEEEKKNPQWWIFALGGVLLGGGIGCAVPIAVYSNRQRREDELRL